MPEVRETRLPVPSLAPWHHLGALGFFLFWIVAASGIYLFVFFDTSVAGAHASLERLTREQWWFGGVMRSLHRYGSDAFVAVALLHLVRELIAGHFRGFRWFSWITGVVLLWFIYGSGIVGYWLVWDRVAQFSVTATAEWFDAIRLGAGPMVRNFLAPADVTDRLFSLFVFLHIGVPLALLAAMWIHIQRIAHTDTNPPARLGWSVLGALLAVSVVRPAHSDAPAQFGLLAAALPLDWFYLAPHPLMYATSPAALWWMAGGTTLALLALPLFARRRRDAAVVDLTRCTGCGHCAHDCPYLAISLVPRTDGRSFLKQAVVRAQQCAACGICAGSCPTAAPLANGAVRPGIDLPGRALREVKAEIDRIDLARRMLVFRCRHDQAEVPAGAIAVMLECAGQLPPSFIDHALRRRADRVTVAGCRPGACEYRLGASWTEARAAGTREPHLNATVNRGRVLLRWWRSRINTMPVQLAALASVAALLAWLSFDPPYRPLEADQALLRVIVVHAGERLAPCRKLGPEELAARAPNMRAPEVCPRGRHAVPVRVELDREVLVDETLPSTGAAHDGPAQLYRRIPIREGRYTLRARVADSPRPGARTWERVQEIEISSGRVLTIDFRPDQGGIVFL